MLKPSENKMKLAYRHRKEIYAIALFTFALIVIACVPGTGYNVVNLELTQGSPISGGGVGDGRTVNRLYYGYLQVQFNPALYPISFLMGNENVFRKFRGAAEFWDYGGEQLKEAVTLGTLCTEVVRNLPYFIAASFLATLLGMRLAKTSTFKRIMPKPRTQDTSYT